MADPMMEEVPCQEASIAVAVAVAETPLSFVRNHRMPQQSFSNQATKRYRYIEKISDP